MIAENTGYGKPFVAIVTLLVLALIGLWKLAQVEAQKPQLIIHTEHEASTTPVSTVY